MFDHGRMTATPLLPGAVESAKIVSARATRYFMSFFMLAAAFMPVAALALSQRNF